MKRSNTWYLIGLSLMILMTLTLFTGFKAESETVVKEYIGDNQSYLNMRDTLMNRIGKYSVKRRKMESYLIRLDVSSEYKYTDENYVLKGVLDNEKEHLKDIQLLWQKQDVITWRTDSSKIQQELESHDETIQDFEKAYESYVKKISH